MATIVNSVIAFFLSMGIFTAQHDTEGKPQRTTGRLPSGLAWYATAPRPSGKDSWTSKDGSRGGTKALAVLNTPAQYVIDPDTGEKVITQEASVEYIDVCFPKLVNIAKGDQVLARGNWVAGKPFVGRDGSPSKWNDTLFVTEHVVIPASVREAAKLTAITVSEPVPVETAQAETAPLSEAAASFIADMEAAAPAPARRRSRK